MLSGVGALKRRLVAVGPWAPRPEAAGQALILGFSWRMAKPTPSPRTRQLVGPDACMLHVDRAAGSRAGGGTTRPCLPSAWPGLPHPAPPPSPGGSGRAAGRRRVSGPLLRGMLLSSLGASPHCALWAPSVLGHRWGGEESQVPQLPAASLASAPTSIPRMDSGLPQVVLIWT